MDSSRALSYTLQKTGEIRQATPYSEPVLAKPAATPGPRAQANTRIRTRKNFFKRVLEHVTGWIERRTATVKLNRALIPFIRKARDKASVSLTDEHFNKLAFALALANSVNDGPDELINKVVSNSVKRLNLAQKIAVREQFSARTKQGYQTEDSFLFALNACVQDAIITEGKNNLSEALRVFEQHSRASFRVDQAANDMQHSLETILDLVHPGSDAIASPRSKAQLPDNFRSASMIISQENVQPWFNRQPPAQQNRIRLNLRATAMDLSMENSFIRSEKLLQAFCASIMDALPSGGKRQA